MWNKYFIYRLQQQQQQTLNTLNTYMEVASIGMNIYLINFNFTIYFEQQQQQEHWPLKQRMLANRNLALFI